LGRYKTYFVNGNVLCHRPMQQLASPDVEPREM